ncbi:hypothetical protein EJ110_NYTH01184 [Nymphaea thermarum]|nr:hypothetical protein EJ110_NYTH01184 [Nymphaea thermarum]
MPNVGYFEFLPHDPNQPHEPNHTQLLDLTDLQLDKEYELVITTYAGLYRYRVRDILRVSGFHNSDPQFHFVRRKNVALIIDSDKTDWAELQKAVEAASNWLMKDNQTRIMEYTSYADTKTMPGHFVVFFELASDKGPDPAPVPEGVMEECCLAMEEELNSVYRQGRVCDQSIGPLEIKVVQCDTFEKLMEYAISRGTSINQYEAPGIPRAAVMHQFMRQHCSWKSALPALNGAPASPFHQTTGAYVGAKPTLASPIVYHRYGVYYLQSVVDSSEAPFAKDTVPDCAA